MRYEDASHTDAFQGSGPIANDDADTLTAGARAPATGNVITGEGTQYSAAGADAAAGAHVTAIAGQGGEDNSFSGGKLGVSGQFGSLSMDADGNYSYVAHKDAPENVRDRFTYTLADNQGGTDTAALIVEIGKTPVVIKANATQIVPGPDGVVTLPPGVELSDVMVVGRNLVVNMPDGTQLIIVDGAVFVPQLVLGGVEVPATNVAALLIGQEPQPAAGELPPSSGGNFAVPPPPLDPGVPLGDLIPPTVYTYIPPDPQEVFDIFDRDPEITIQPDGQPASVAAVDSVDEKGLPGRDGNLPNEPQGSGEEAAAGANGDPSEATAGTIIINSPDGVDSVTINGVLVTGAIGQQIAGDYGTLTITGFSGQNILYSYLLNDNTSGNSTHDDFGVTLTDNDGDQASATLVIDIIDDVPTARPDTDTVGVGGFLATGNVVTDASLGDLGDTDTNAADTVGADNARVTFIDSVNAAPGANVPDGSFIDIAGQYGTLRIFSNGDYVYTRSPQSGGGVDDVFNYTLTDGDGDTSTTTLTITIPDTPIAIQFGGGVGLDDDVIPGANGIVDGPGDDDPDVVGANVVNGNVSVQGGDGTLTYSIQITGAPAGFTYVAGPNGSLLIQQNGVTVITATIDPATGDYTVTQNHQIDHPTLDGQAGDDTENNVVFPVTVRVTDADGDFAESTGQIIVDDDSPEMNRADISLPTLHVDETVLATNDSGDFSVIFNGAYGADGAGSTSYAISTVNGTNSGLVDTATGLPVLLYNIGGVVTGSTSATLGGVAADNTVFTVSVNSGTGVVTLDQVRAVIHPDPTSNDEPVSPIASSIQLTATITDHDGDSDSLSANIGNSLVLDDDGPSISAGGTQPSLTVDETVLATNASASFASIFTPVFGADGAGTVAYALGISAPGANSGLIDVATGSAIVLVLNAGVVEGHVGNAAGALAFTVSIDAAGVVTLDQIRAVQHPNPANPDDSVTLGADNLVTVTATVTDKDGDQASATADIGQNLNFEDDGPSISSGGVEPTITVDETNLAANASANFAGNFTSAFGADGAGTVAYALTITGGNGVASGMFDVATGSSIVLVNNAGVIEGHVGTAAGALAFTVSVDGSGNVTLDQVRAVTHPNASDPNDSVTFATDDLLVLTATVTDKDGDQASASLNIGRNLIVDDDGPSINANGTQPNLTVDETVLATNASASFAGVFSSSFGSDGAGTLAYTLGITGGNGVASGLIDVATGSAIVLVNNAGVIEGHVGTAAGALAFTVTIDGSGNVTLDQIRAVQHPNPANPDDSVTLANDNLITVTATITDRDGDQQSATANIGQNLNFEDDGPSIGAGGTQPTLTVDETVLATNASASFAGVFTPLFGADGAAAANSVTYALGITGANGVASGLIDVATGQSIVLVNNAGVIEGHVGTQAGALAFTVTADASGNVTLDQIRALQHPNPANPDDPVTLANDNLITLTATATDKDGDQASATANIGQNLVFEDDGPSAQNDVDSIVGGNGPATGNVITGVEVAVAEDANATDGVADNVGADAPGTITLIASNNVPANTDSTYTAGNLVVNGQYGTLTINANGDYSYLRTAPAGGVQDVFTYTLTDADGDSTTATLTISIQDNFPVLPDPATILLDDDVIPAAGGNLDGPGDDNPDTVPGNVVNGTLVGSGGDAPLTYNFTGINTLPAGFSIGAGSDADTLLINQGGTLVMTIQLNQSTGAFTVTQNAPILHDPTNPGAGGGQASNFEDNLNFSIGVEVEDADHDKEPATITINVDDDTPTINVTQSGESAVILTTDDAQTIGVNSDTAVSTANFSGVFGLTQSAGADGTAAAATLSYALDVTGFAGGPGGVNSNLESHDADIFLYEIGGKVVGSTSTTLAGVLPGNTVFDVAVNGSGVVTLTQYQQIDHDTVDPTPTGGPPFADHIVSLVDNLVTLTASATLTDRDGDTVTDSEVANIGANLQFTDDGPSAAIVEAAQAVILDESVGIQVDSKDTTNAGVIALFAGVTNTGTDTDLPQYAQSTAALVASTGSAYGADGAGTTLFSINVSSAGVDSGLNTTGGQDILLFKEGSLIVGRVSGGPDNGKAALAIAIDPVTGLVSTVEYLSIQHLNAANPDDSMSIVDGAVLAVVTVTDFDGDTATSQVGIGSQIQFQDSAPVMTAAQNMNIQNSGDVAHTGAFAFNLGADGANIATNDVITNVTGSATVGGVAVTGWSLTPVSEDATTASYSFQFDYPIGGGNTAHETGTLVFNKLAGTYTIDLANPIQGVTTILQTATGTLFQGYEPGTSTVDGSQPAISVTQIQDLAGTANDIYVQFTSVAEPSSGTGDNNLEFSNWVPGANNPDPVSPGGDTTWNPGQVFNQTDSWVSTSNDANGVAGDTIQGGEVLDFSLVQGPNPTGVLAAPSTYAQATSMFLKFDGIGTGEDMIVLVKVYDTVLHTYSTVALMVQNSDIQKGPGSGPGIYSNVTLDQNDGLIVIEPNDYQQGNTNLVIVGAQIAGSDEGLSGTALDFTYGGVLGVASTGNQDFSVDVNDGPFKISSIGFTTVSTTPQNAQLDFNVTVTDGDGDSITQAISATVTPAADSTSAATIPAANTTVAPVVLDLNGDGVQFLGADAGVHYNYGDGSVATGWVGPDDGMLVRDANGNGTVDGAGEFVFGSGGQTDMQALAAQYGSALNAGDADYAKFGVWQDANSNGAVDAGEYQTLAAAGIVSINLVSDGVSYSAAGGDVNVAGSSIYTNSDGSTGIAADAAFWTGGRAASDEQRALTGSTSNIALAAAVAAVGLTHSYAAAANPAFSEMTFDSSVHQTFQTVNLNGDGRAAFEDSVSRLSLGNESIEPAFNAVSLSNSNHSFNDNSFGSHGLEAISFGNAAPAYVPHFAANEAMASSGAAFTMAPSIGMPSAAMLQAAGGLQGNVQHGGGTIEAIVSDALGQGNAPATVDALLNAFHGGGAGELGSIANMASGPASGVPSWDMTMHGAFGFGQDMMMKMGAEMLHHDAVQPVQNG